MKVIFKKYIKIIDRGGDASELSNILELVSDAWNYFPHKLLEWSFSGGDVEDFLVDRVLISIVKTLLCLSFHNVATSCHPS